MSSPPSLKRIATEGLEDLPESFLNDFLFQLNPFLRDVSNALTKGINSDNLATEEREFTFTTGGGGPYADSAPFPILLSPQTVKAPKNFVVTAVKTSGAIVGGVWAWCELASNGDVKVRFVSGLDTSTQYTIRLRWD